MKTSILNSCLLLLSTILFWGCPSTPPKVEKEIARRPELTIQIATINLGQFSRRIERKQITELARALKREHVEVLAVQGITRYPGLATRVDFVSELTGQTDWRNVFGEMLNISGRQTGNAIFSSYPILSHHNEMFDDVKSSNFDAALEATVDAGVRALAVISAQVPSKASTEEQVRCMKLIAALNPEEKNPLTIVTGNLPSAESVLASTTFAEVPPLASVNASVSKLWYSPNAGLQLLSSRSVETELGSLMIVQLGLFRQK